MELWQAGAKRLLYDVSSVPEVDLDMNSSHVGSNAPEDWPLSLKPGILKRLLAALSLNGF
jgi:hypothetical protein